MRYVSVFILFSLFVQPVAAQYSAQLLFDEANSALEQGDFSNALATYKTIAATDVVSGSLFINMGIAATELDSLGLAKYYFAKALRFKGSEEKAKEGLEYVNSQFSRQSAILPKLPWDNATQWLIQKAGAFTVFYIGMGFVFVGLLLIFIKWFSRFRLPKQNTITGSLITIGILIIFLAFYADYVDQRYHEAIFVYEETRVMKQPDESSEVVSLAYEGYEVTVDAYKSKSRPGWYYIRLGNGQFGWLKTDGVKVL